MWESHRHARQSLSRCVEVCGRILRAQYTRMKQAKWKLSVAREISGASPRSHIRGDNYPISSNFMRNPNVDVQIRF
jgi:hypothetical protein